MPKEAPPKLYERSTTMLGGPLKGNETNWLLFSMTSFDSVARLAKWKISRSGRVSIKRQEESYFDAVHSANPRDQLWGAAHLLTGEVLLLLAVAIHQRSGRSASHGRQPWLSGHRKKISKESLPGYFMFEFLVKRALSNLARASGKVADWTAKMKFAELGDKASDLGRIGAWLSDNRQKISKRLASEINTRLLEFESLADQICKFADLSGVTGQETNREPGPADAIESLGERRYRIGNHPPMELTEREDEALQALLKSPGIGKSAFGIKSGLGEDAPRVLKLLTSRHGGIFAPAIHLPGKKNNGGYRVDFVDSEQFVPPNSTPNYSPI